MIEVQDTPGKDGGAAVERTRTLTLVRCEVKLGRAAHVGEPETIPLAEAMQRLAPSGTYRAKMNVINARVGWYIGLMEKAGQQYPGNFLFKNPTSGSDIRWILQDMPEFEDVVLELYYVKDVEIPNGIEGEPVIQRGRPRA